MTDFSLEDKMDAIEDLKKSNFDYGAICQKYNINLPTLKKWEKIVVPVFGKEGDAQIISLVAKDDDQLEKQYVRLAKESRNMLLQKIRDLAADETDIDKLTKALKLLHDISRDDDLFGTTAGGRSKAGSWHEKVTKAIVEIKEKREITNGEDTD